MLVDIHAKVVTANNVTRSHPAAPVEPIQHIVLPPTPQESSASTEKFTLVELAWNAFYAVSDLLVAVLFLACQVVVHAAEKRHPKAVMCVRRVGMWPKRIMKRIPEKFFSW